LTELERFRAQVHKLKHENAQLRAQLANDTAIRDLLRTIEQLEKKKHHLLTENIHPANAPPPEFVTHLTELEEELANLNTMHITNQQLHANTSIRRTLRNLHKLLAQLLVGDVHCVEVGELLLELGEVRDELGWFRVVGVALFIF
jgi:hypothetical protein